MQWQQCLPGSTDQQQCYAVHGQRMRSLLTTTGARLQGGVMLQCCSVDSHQAHSAVVTQAPVLQAAAAGKLTAAFPLQSVGSVVETRAVQWEGAAAALLTPAAPPLGSINMM